MKTITKTCMNLAMSLPSILLIVMKSTPSSWLGLTSAKKKYCISMSRPSDIKIQIGKMSSSPLVPALDPAAPAAPWSMRPLWSKSGPQTISSVMPAGL